MEDNSLGSMGRAERVAILKLLDVVPSSPAGSRCVEKMRVSSHSKASFRLKALAPIGELVSENILEG